MNHQVLSEFLMYIFLFLAKTNDNVTEVFYSLSKLILEKIDQNKLNPNQDVRFDF